MTQKSEIVSLFNEARPGYLFAELLAIRESLIGSQALINLIKSGCAPESLEVAICETTKTQQDPDERPHQDSLVNVNVLTSMYITQVAAGDAILRSSSPFHQLLPAPTVPGSSILAAFKKAEYPQPDYKPLWDFVERERACDNLDQTWEDGNGKQGLPWRTRLTRNLKLLNDRYYELFISQAVLFEDEERLFHCPQNILDEAIATIKLFPAPAAVALPSNSESAPLKRGYLERLRSRGASAIIVLGRYAREHGNELVRLADTLKEDTAIIRMPDRCGEPAPVKPEHWVGRQFIYEMARMGYSDATRVPEHSAVGMCNSAAMFLKRNELRHGATTYSGKRASCVRAIATGYTPELPESIRPPQTPAARKDELTVAWKAQMRFAKAHSGLMQNEMKKNTRPSEVKKTCDLAIGAYDQALLANPNDSSPKKEQAVVLKLYTDYEKRFGK